MHPTISIFILLLLLLNVNDLLGKAGDRTKTCTCSRPSTSGYYCDVMTCITTTETVKCFSGRSTVQTPDGRSMPLSDIHVGQKVLVFDGIHSKFESIYDFIHLEQTGLYEFLRLTYIVDKQSNITASVELSSNHLIFVYDQPNPVFASEVSIGSHLEIITGATPTFGQVIRVETVQSQGFYAPLTPTGTIVIDNVVCSNYANVRNHRLAHLAMQPYRWWRMFIGPRTSITREINWYASILQLFVEKTGLIRFLESN